MPELKNLIREFNGEDKYDILPVFKLFTKSKNNKSLLQSAWFPNQQYLWISLYDKILSQLQNEVNIFEMNITGHHIFQTNCDYCSMLCMHTISSCML